MPYPMLSSQQSILFTRQSDENDRAAQLRFRLKESLGDCNHLAHTESVVARAGVNRPVSVNAIGVVVRCINHRLIFELCIRPFEYAYDVAARLLLALHLR
ncbi:MAG: hypothetical protein JMDDDDMK_05497 [Acidobacteria bacterium]|nr:hypothetical protein [Acidobacteriota bacterium]